jgi:glycerol uptake facilitator-like aquaporin
MTLRKRAFAELLGTFWLLLGGCGAGLAEASPSPWIDVPVSK